MAAPLDAAARRTGARWLRRAALALALAGVLARPGLAVPECVRVALLPARATLAAGDTLALELRVTRPGPGFNAYDAIVVYDPRALEFVPGTPVSRQEGEAMTGACGNTFHRFRADGDSLVIAHVLLCAGVSLRGPAELYRLRFRALAPGATSVRLRRTQFYDAGRSLTAALTSDAAVTVAAPRRERRER